MTDNAFQYQDETVISGSKDGLIHGIALTITESTGSPIDCEEGLASEVLQGLVTLEKIYGDIGIHTGMRVKGHDFVVSGKHFDKDSFLITYVLRKL